MQRLFKFVMLPLTVPVMLALGLWTAIANWRDGVCRRSWNGKCLLLRHVKEGSSWISANPRYRVTERCDKDGHYYLTVNCGGIAAGRQWTSPPSIEEVIVAIKELGAHSLKPVEGIL